MAGKKRKIIDANTVSLMRERGLSWTEIAARVDITTRTLQRWRLETDFIDPQQRITDGALDELISTHIEGQPRRGEITLRSSSY